MGHVLAKEAPNVDDAGVRRRAVEAVVARAVRREVNDRVRWIGPRGREAGV